MAKLLYIESSPRKERSKSIRISNAFLDTYRSQNPGDEVVEIDLWKRSLPEFDGFTIDARYQITNGKDFDADQKKAWEEVVAVCEEFKSADKYVVSVPMWNFGVPYKLKHYIDVIAQPGQTFSFDPDAGYDGLVKGKPAVAIYARGGAYGGDASGMDHQKPYVEQMLQFFGFQDVQSIVIEPTLGDPEEVAKTEAKAIDSAKDLAAQF